MSKVAADLSVVTSVGLDLAKHVFQVHAVDAGGKVIVARALGLQCHFTKSPITPLVKARPDPDRAVVTAERFLMRMIEVSSKHTLHGARGAGLRPSG